MTLRRTTPHDSYTERAPRDGAWRLVDGLAVGAAVAVGLALATPAVHAARVDSARAKCAENLRLVGAGAGRFGAANDERLPANRVRGTFGSWNTQLLPFIGEEKLAARYSDARDWWDARQSENRAVAATRVASFVCPASPRPERSVATTDPDAEKGTFDAAATDYVGSAGAYQNNNVAENLHPGAMHHRTILRSLRLADVADGAAQTLLVVEMADKPNHWRAGGLAEDKSKSPQMTTFGGGQWAAPNWNHLRSHTADGKEQFGPCAVNCSNQGAIYGFHSGGANALFVDGSVKFLPAGMSQEMLVALVSIAGGEVVNPRDF